MPAAAAPTNSSVVIGRRRTDSKFVATVVRVLMRSHHTHITWKLQLEESPGPWKKLETE